MLVNTKDGVIFSFYLRAKSADSDVSTPIKSVSCKLFEENTVPDPGDPPPPPPVDEKIYITFEFTVGDVDSDGVISSFDAQKILELVTKYGDMTESEARTYFHVFSDCVNLYQEGFFLFGVLDVDGDGKVTMADAEEIL